jgi:arginine N-succinyltransferase
MLVLRPVSLEDLDALLALSQFTQFGLTTLPRDRNLLARRIDESRQAFATLAGVKPRGEAYLFVMQDTDTHAVVGTCGIVSKVGGFEPFYAYRIETTVHESKTLGVRKTVDALHLVTDHDGPCEIGSLFLHPEARGGGAGRVLSLSRFLFMAEHPDLFDPVVIAEMRGVIDDRGRSPFWDALGKHFFDLDFPKADYLSIVNKEFIGDLMPTHPIYIPLLPAEAQAVIAQVHEKTKPALAMLESEGFVFSNMVDIFEAGPVMRCRRDEIRTVRQSKKLPIGKLTNEAIDGVDYVISNARRDFRACKTRLKLNGETVTLPHDAALALDVTIDDPVRFATLRPPA